MKTAKKTFRNAATPIPAALLCETSCETSQTIPDQAMSMREILHRYTSGATLDVNNHTPVYLENVPWYDTRRKHEIDLAVDRLNHEKTLDKMSKKVYDNKTALQQLDADQAEFEEYQKKNKNTPNPDGEA